MATQEIRIWWNSKGGFWRFKWSLIDWSMSYSHFHLWPIKPDSSPIECSQAHAVVKCSNSFGLYPNLSILFLLSLNFIRRKSVLDDFELSMNGSMEWMGHVLQFADFIVYFSKLNVEYWLYGMVTELDNHIEWWTSSYTSHEKKVLEKDCTPNNFLIMLINVSKSTPLKSQPKNPFILIEHRTDDDVHVISMWSYCKILIEWLRHKY